MNIKLKFISTILPIVVTSCIPQGPQVVFSKYVIDFGKINEGITCDTSVMLYNTGDKQLKIFSATTDCGCTKVYMNQKSLNAGDSAALHISLNTKNKSGNTENFVVIQANTDTTLHYIKVISDVKPKN